ncbi:rCG61009 [Rattus norvegicus]|uniref:RCG61009 n=1 Tax=Rattus norvegicus TaxID=10116 RepID=A6JK90_RAT|nr:rCG61009 [Rattus norvegicus]
MLTQSHGLGKNVIRTGFVAAVWFAEQSGSVIILDFIGEVKSIFVILRF